MNLFPWTVFLPKGFENGIIQRFLTGDHMAWGGAFHFLPVFSKKKILWKLWLWFSKKFLWLNRVFCDLIWRISKFRFWRQILDIYRQPLLTWVLNSTAVAVIQLFLLNEFVNHSGISKLDHMSDTAVLTFTFRYLSSPLFPLSLTHFFFCCCEFSRLHFGAKCFEENF